MILASSCFLLLTFTIHAVSGPADEAWDAYLAGEFQRVETIVDRAVADTSLSDGELARLFLALGCSDAMRNRKASAVAAFERALSLNLDIDATSSDLPPPAWELFKPVRDRMVQSRDQKSVSSPLYNPKFKQAADTVYLKPDTVRVPVNTGFRASSAVKSLVLPGWAMWSEGRKRGLIYLGLETVALGGWIYAAVNANRTHDEYRALREPSEIDRKYEDYNRYYKLAWGMGLAAAGIYLVSQYDHLTGTPNVGLMVGSPQNAAGVRLFCVW